MSTQLDPRGPQFAGALTAVVLATVLLLAPGPLAVALLAAQAALFAIGAGLGVQHTPQAWLFRSFVRPRLAPPRDWEDAAPPRFAQGVGLAFAYAWQLAFVAAAGFVLTSTAILMQLLGECGAFPSGDSLKSTETGLVRKPKARARAFGESWEEVLRLGLAGMEDARAADSSLEVIWADPETKGLGELVDAVSEIGVVAHDEQVDVAAGVTVASGS